MCPEPCVRPCVVKLVLRLRHAVVVEATYGVNRHEERVTREQRLVSTVRGIVSRGGRVLMPVVALGRAQVNVCRVQPGSFLEARCIHCDHCVQPRM